jgi:hypothetical protein
MESAREPGVRRLDFVLVRRREEVFSVLIHKKKRGLLHLLETKVLSVYFQCDFRENVCSKLYYC